MAPSLKELEPEEDVVEVGHIVEQVQDFFLFPQNLFGRFSRNPQNLFGRFSRNSQECDFNKGIQASKAATLLRQAYPSHQQRCRSL